LLAVVLDKAQFWQRWAGTPMNARRTLVLNRVLDCMSFYWNLTPITQLPLAAVRALSMHGWFTYSFNWNLTPITLDGLQDLGANVSPRFGRGKFSGTELLSFRGHDGSP
jgi:hypothetical protein